MNSIKSVSIMGLALLAVGAFAQAGPPISVVVDGDPIVFPNQQPAESDGRVLVPLRGVFEKLGASVDWDPSTQTITARKKGAKVTLTIGQLDASVDNHPVHMDVPATLVGGTTMVPLRFVSEALGAYVTWNAANHEVDIRRTTDYDLPKHHDNHPAPPPHPFIITRPPPPMIDHRPTFGVIGADTVLPLTLTTRLSSSNAQRGDLFTATLNTDGTRHYFDLPAGTVAYGSVSYVRRMDRMHPGVIELNFDHLVLPNGRHLHIVGKLVGLGDSGIQRLPNGEMVERNAPRNDHVVFSGYGDGVGMVVGFKGQGNIEIGRMLDGELRMKPRNLRNHDVELRPGTPLGVLLYQDLVVPRH